MAGPLDPVSAENWNRERARHLLNRAGFGGPEERMKKLLELGPQKSVDHLLTFADQGKENSPEPLLEPGIHNKGNRQLLRGMKREWIRRMIQTDHPLREKLTLFWHGHFATSADKVRSAELNNDLNHVFRNHAAGDFAVLLRETIRSPAMLMYLDNTQNRRGNPNENLARELMELFTMGLGNYTEKDIKEVARALTGWTVQNEAFHFKKKAHDPGTKEFLGHQGMFDGNDVLRIILKQEATPMFIVRKLWSFFAYPEPEEKIVRGLGATLAKQNYQLAPVLREMFRSRAFYSEKAMGSRIKNPVELFVGLVHDLDLSPNEKLWKKGESALSEMGQNLFYPPNVSGWPSGREWINTRWLLSRFNTAGELVLKDRYSFEPESYVSSFGNQSVGNAMDEICNRLLSRDLSSADQEEIRKVLVPDAGADDPFKPSDVSGDSLRNGLHLLLSTAEYQFC